jgi:DNA helicase II / ATP-dependent DNA helicase PcrA
MELNDEQKKVVDSNERFLFLLAGAGSGKTRVIVERIKHLLSKGVQPKEILAITFTRKAAHEMRERVGNDQVDIHTFHQFCFLRLKADYQMSFTMVEEEKLPFEEMNYSKLRGIKIVFFNYLDRINIQNIKHI